MLTNLNILTANDKDYNAVYFYFVIVLFCLLAYITLALASK